ncbi:MAG: T9SS C-terminal target domain-containing protein [Bacteroidetes bacterium]|nr:MAG: T9SS C-terminal target domain-containing protein [Bacteroidota bacterium]
MNKVKLTLCFLLAMSALSFSARAQCVIENVIAEAHDCSPNGTFFVDIAFEHFGTGAEGFRIQGNGTNYGNFSYDEPFVTIGPLAGDGTTVYEFVVTDNQVNGCSDFTTLGPILCDAPPSCLISDVIAEPHDCADDGTFYVDIDFNFTGVNDVEGFRIQGNGTNYGNFQYDSLPVTLGPFAGDGTSVYEFVVIDNVYDDCADFAELGPIDCAPACDISVFNLIPGPCKTQFSYELTIELVAQNPSSDYVELSYGGLSLGTFPLSAFPLTIPNFYDFGENSPLLLAQIGDGDCFALADFEAPNCNDDPDDCFIGSILYWTGPCNDQGNYDVSLFFDVENANDAFNVFYAGELLGTFPLSQIPVTLENFEDQGEPFPVLQICINDHPDCCREVVLENPCTGQGCEIFDLIVEPHPCDADGNFLLDIAFQSNHTGVEGFSVFGNGHNYGSFSYDAPFITIGPLPGDGSVSELAIVDNQFPDCGTAIDFDPIFCGSDCQIVDLTVETGDCNDDGTYNLWLNFGVENPGNDFFEVWSGDHYLGFFPLNELPLHIGQFPASGNFFDPLRICVNDHPDCCLELDVEAPPCAVGNCDIFDFWVEAGDCHDDGTYPIWLDFQTIAPTHDHFDLIYNGEIIGYYALADLPLHIPHFTGIGEPIEVLTVCINDNPDCCETVGFPAPDCGGNPHDCAISNMWVEPDTCNADGLFYVTLGFDFEGTGVAGFSVLGNGNDYGDFEYDSLPVLVGPFEGGDHTFELIVIDNQKPACSETIEFGPWFCDDDCHISNVQVHPTDCNDAGEFYVTLDFAWQNVSDLGFSVRGNGNYYGFFEYDSLPVVIGPLIGDGVTVYEFGVRDSLFQDCHAGTHIGPVGCPGAICEIYDLVVDPGDCNSDGTYNLWLNFEVNNPTNDLFEVFRGDHLLGTFPLNELPVFIPEYPATGDSIDHLTVCINDNPDCCETVAFPAPDCALVWPGDANDDNIANHFDLLNIGLAYGTEGFERPEPGLAWFGHVSENWPAFFENNVNFKHADCNGNGIVNADDKAAILENYDFTHGTVNGYEPLPGTDDDPPLFVDLNATDIQPGQPFEAPIVLGIPDQPVEDIYGLAFTIEFNPVLIDPASVEIAYDQSWLGSQGEDLLELDKTKADEGRVEVAISRIDQTNVSGFGQIAAFIGIIDDIAGKQQEITIEITGVRAIRNNEVRIPLRTPVESVEIVGTTQNNPPNLRLQITPNPTSGHLRISNSRNMPVEFIEIRDLTGRILQTLPEPGSELDLSALADGLYLLHVVVDGRRFVERIVKVK